MRVFRKVILPAVWAVIFATIAVSLAVMAFDSPPKSAGSGVLPTGEIPVSNTIVGRDTVENTLELQGTIVVDPAVPAKAARAGVVNHFFVPVGTKVAEGDLLFQVKYEDSPTVEGADNADDSSDKKSPPKPAYKYVNTVAPKAGKIASFAKELGDDVAKGDAVASVQQLSFRATGSISPIDQYRLVDMPESATVTINGGPAPFECDDLSLGGSAPAPAPSGEFDPAEEPQFQGGAEGGGGVSISCRVPDDVQVFDGLPMGMAIDAGTAEDVLVVPVTAVRGLVDSGTVWVTDAGEPVQREVRLGVSDGNVVQVKKGLKEGENILEFVPGGSGAAESLE